MEYVFFCILAIIITIGWHVYQSKGLKKATNNIEKEVMIPTLDYLYKNPNAMDKHQQFIQSLKNVDKFATQYKDASYLPSDDIFTRLFQHTDKYPEDQLGHERFLRIIGRLKLFNNEIVFKQLIKQVSKFPENSFTQERLAICVEKGHLLPPVLLDLFISYLDENPTNSVRQKIFMLGISKIMFLSGSSEKRQGIYNKALQILEENPDSKSAKQFVLTMGRWHFGKARPDGKVSIYDEQMIQNDIFVRVNQ